MKRIHLLLTFLVFVSFLGCGGAPSPQEIAALTVTAAEPVQGEEVVAAAQDWPWWRGPHSDGHVLEGDIATTWSATENIAWKVAVPGKGHSSPIVCGENIFLTTADEGAQEQLVLCFDRNTGEQRWQTVIHKGNFMRSHGKNSFASATPTCDGEHIFVAFINGGNLWVTALDFAGQIVWQKTAGEFEAEHGYGPSPVIYKSAVIVNGDNAHASFVAAMDRTTGKLLWRTPRERPGIHGSYGTPFVANIAGKPQLLLSGHQKMSSYDPSTGKLLWHCVGPAEVTANTVAVGEDLVFTSGGYPEKQLLAIRADGEGEVTDTHVVWKKTKGVTYVPSPLFGEGRLYVVNDQGIASCYTASNGEQLWQKRLDGDFSASPILVGDKLLVTNERGMTFVLKAGPEYELISENDLGSGGFASPVLCGNRLLFRTSDSLVCVGSSAAVTDEDKAPGGEQSVRLDLKNFGGPTLSN
ncbi:outer membrane protein assembly factor BamB family protein [Bythopirellula polymerisocia]|uniref:Outer membrane biogenesis protein BamB n=1 Tax=Bythopirellula polymerisocia TaxID=2528003 RepID=A0A5C6C9J5_9BACT|nr:PQQ-binding-like beta-propeller repeat protein [Bythopirellula polymerisocia]TWU20838.1 outer membrane biogenesis protein BamB [Bythopirellula polymerisocia]